MELGYWAIKGRAEVLRMMLAYFKLEYTEVNPTSYEDAHAKFAKYHFSFPNLPYLVDGDNHFTESTAIPLYIAQKAGATDFFGKQGIEQVYHAEVLGVERDVVDVITQIFFKDDAPEFTISKKDFFLRKFKDLSQKLGNKQYFFDHLTYSDFLMHFLLTSYKRVTEHLKVEDHSTEFPNLLEHTNRIGNLPGLKEFLSSEAAKSRPYMPPHMAKVKI